MRLINKSRIIRICDFLMTAYYLGSFILAVYGGWLLFNFYPFKVSNANGIVIILFYSFNFWLNLGPLLFLAEGMIKFGCKKGLLRSHCPDEGKTVGDLLREQRKKWPRKKHIDLMAYYKNKLAGENKKKKNK